MNVLIFSKDRACQLELLLRSIKENFEEVVNENVYILYKYSNDQFKVGYDKLKEMYDYNWVLETNFKEDVLNIANSFKCEYCVAFVDDEIVINDFSIDDSITLLNSNKNIHCISLRMHPTINYTYTSNTDSPPPNLDTIGNCISWNWKTYLNTTQKTYADWSYPAAINSHIYSTVFFQNILKEIGDFNAPNSLENGLFHKRNLFRENIICFEKPKTICIVNNITQIECENRTGSKDEFSLESLNTKFLDGFRIKSENLYGIECNQVHIEKDYEFENIINNI